MIVIAAGGTGGHMLPGLAIAEAIVHARPEMPICFVGAGREIEGSLVEGHRVYSTGVRTFSSGIKGRLAPLSVISAVVQARGILRRTGARAVVGMGGYPSLPVVLAARTRRIPAILHEQNAVPGLANSACARFTPHIAVSFDQAMESFGSREPRLVGVPLRGSILSLADPATRAAAREEGHRMFGLDPSRKTVVVIGGSLGARRVNDAVLEMASSWASRTDVQILLACGRANVEVVAGRAAGVANLRVEAFLERMDLAYAVADVAVTRGGASTVAELAATGTPAIIVPFPGARRQEQHANAKALTSVGGGLMIEDGTLNAARLSTMLEPLILDDSRLAEMRSDALTQARPDAARHMASFVLEVLDAA